MTQPTSPTALHDCDVQALLRAVLDGRCVLGGQTEPFVWLIGRMVDQGARC